MIKDTYKTKVIFRKFKEGDVIALFPEVPGDYNPALMCNSYMTIGQHGAARVTISDVTTLATPQEYSDLKAELESLGYDLRIAYRFTRADYIKRKEACHANT